MLSTGNNLNFSFVRNLPNGFSVNVQTNVVSHKPSFYYATYIVFSCKAP